MRLFVLICVFSLSITSQAAGLSIDDIVSTLNNPIVKNAVGDQNIISIKQVEEIGRAGFDVSLVICAAGSDYTKTRINGKAIFYGKIEAEDVTQTRSDELDEENCL